MKNLLTGAAQSVTNPNERVRKLFEDRPMEAPAPQERKSFNSRKKPLVAAAEEAQDDDASQDVTPEAGVPEADEPILTEEDAEEE